MLSPSPDLEHRVAGFMQRRQLIIPGQTLVAAVSGGPDSVCLLHILWKLREGLGLNLHVAHLNHRLRGTDSDGDAEYVTQLAKRLGLPVTVEAADVQSYRKEHHLSLEAAAREVRYAFLSGVVQSVGAAGVAVGHTRDDHIETVLMHLIRGAGITGLRGLQPLTILNLTGHVLTVVRPVLEVSRNETQGYCAANNLEPRFDATNLSLTPLRNKIRLRLLPSLRKLNSGIEDELLRTARLAGEDLDFIEDQVRRVWDEVVQIRSGIAVLRKKPLLELHVVLQRELLRRVIAALRGNLKDIEARHIEALINALPGPSGKCVCLPFGLIFTTEHDRYLLGADPVSLTPFPPLKSESRLRIPGETIIPGWRITAEIQATNQSGITPDEFTAYLDFARSGNKLTVRKWQAGDRFQPLGLSNHKKVAKFMIDELIPNTWRERIPVVSSAEQIVWVVGYRIDDGVKVTDKAEEVLKITFMQMPEC